MAVPAPTAVAAAGTEVAVDMEVVVVAADMEAVAAAGTGEEAVAEEGMGATREGEQAEGAVAERTQTMLTSPTSPTTTPPALPPRCRSGASLTTLRWPAIALVLVPLRSNLRIASPTFISTTISICLRTAMSGGFRLASGRKSGASLSLQPFRERLYSRTGPLVGIYRVQKPTSRHTLFQTAAALRFRRFSPRGENRGPSVTLVPGVVTNASRPGSGEVSRVAFHNCQRSRGKIVPDTRMRGRPCGSCRPLP